MTLGQPAHFVCNQH